MSNLCILCEKPLRKELDGSVMHQECWTVADTDREEHAKIDWSKYDTGCDCCNCDICRVGDLARHYCYRLHGPAQIGKVTCQYCPEVDENGKYIFD